MRSEMVRHLSERGEEFVKDGQLVVREKTMLYGPNYPKRNDTHIIMELCQNVDSPV